MDELQKLLAIVQSLDPDKREKEEPAPTDDDLVSARTQLHEQLKAAAEGDKPDLEAARAIRTAIDRIDAEQVTRKETLETERAEAAKLLEGLDIETPPADDGSGEEDEQDEGNEEAETEVKVPATVASLADAISRSTKRKTTKDDAQRLVDAQTDVVVSSVGPAQGRELEQDANLSDAARVFSQYAPNVKRNSAVLIHMERMYPDDRALGLNAEQNTRIIDNLASPRAITAAGGICEPLPADFSHPICGDRARPIRDSLPSFRADRGGIRFAPSATIADVVGGITVWTNETDEDPGSDTKACPRVECEEEMSARVDAIVACLTVGNMQARFDPEFWRSRLDLLMVAHDQIAEQTLYAAMLADPVTTTTLVPTGAGDGTVTDVLRVVDMQVAGLKSRHRLIGTQFTTILPSWLRNALRTQLANQAPAGSADLFDIGDARLAAFFTNRGVNPVWSPDIELIGAQAGGAALAAYNTPFNVLTYPEGTFLFLDGGTLDLGTSISDSTLNSTNDRQAFMETFEQVVGRGCSALVTPVAVAADCICA